MALFEKYIDKAREDNPATPHLDIMLSAYLVRSARRGRQKLNQALKAYNMTVMHYWVLRMLEINPVEVSPTVICELLDISRTKATRVVNDLEVAGYLRRLDNHGDRRSLFLEVTPEGFSKLKEMKPIVQVVYTNMWAPLSEQEKSRVVKILSRMIG